MALKENDLVSNSWWIWDKNKDKKNAENEYIQSYQNLANEYVNQASNENYNNDINKAQMDANKTTKAKDDISIANQNTLNTISGNRTTNVNNVSAYSKTNQRNRQASLTTLQAKREFRNQKAESYLKLASDEAKKKYEVASSRYNQAMTNITNTFKIITNLGLSIFAGGKI